MITKNHENRLWGGNRRLFSWFGHLMRCFSLSSNFMNKKRILFIVCGKMSSHLEGMLSFFDEYVPHYLTSRWRLYHRTASLYSFFLLSSFVFLFSFVSTFVKVLKNRWNSGFFLFLFLLSLHIQFIIHTVYYPTGRVVCMCVLPKHFLRICNSKIWWCQCVRVWWVCSSRSPQIKTNGIMCQ